MAKIPVGEAGVDGAAATSSPARVPTLDLQAHPKPLDATARLRRDRAGRMGRRLALRLSLDKAGTGRLRASTTSRYGVAHEAPPPTVLRVCKLAMSVDRLHAST